MKTENLKICPKCKTEKSISLFFKNKSSKDGLAYICKSCSKEYHKDYCSKNRERMNNYVAKSLKKSNYKSVKEYHLRNPQIRKKIDKNSRDNLDDRYVKDVLYHNNLPKELINNPEIIEIKRLIIKTKRLCKTSQN